MSDTADPVRGKGARVALPGVSLHVEDSGGPGIPVAFAHGLFWDTRLFEPQIARLSGARRCIAWDHRGQGRSEVTDAGYDMDTLAQDAIALFTRLGAGPVDFVGLSMGGFVALRVALARPDLVRSLVLIDTSADAEPPANLPRYRLLRFVAGLLGLRLVIGRLMPILFGPAFLADPARAREREEYRRRLAANDRTGILRAVDGVLGRAGVADRLGTLRVPTLVIVGEHDRATPPEKARAIATAIPGARLVVIPEAGHTSTLEAPDAVTTALEDFLAEVDRAAMMRG